MTKRTKTMTNRTQTEYRLCVEKFDRVRRTPKGSGPKGRAKVEKALEDSFRDFLLAPESVQGNLDAWAEERVVTVWLPLSDSPQD